MNHLQEYGKWMQEAFEEIEQGRPSPINTATYFQLTPEEMDGYFHHINSQFLYKGLGELCTTSFSLGKSIIVKEIRTLKRSRNPTGLVTFLVDEQPHTIFVKGYNFSPIVFGGAKWEHISRDNYLRENVFLEKLSASGCFTPHYLGAFEVAEEQRAYIFTSGYKAETVDAYARQLSREDKVSLLKEAAYVLGKFQMRATLHKEEILKAMEENEAKLRPSSPAAFEERWKFWLGLRPRDITLEEILQPKNNLLKKGDQYGLDPVRQEALTILSRGKKLVTHRDMKPHNMLYLPEGEYRNLSAPRLLIIDLEIATVPTTTSAVPCAMYDLSSLLTWPEVDLGINLTRDEEEGIIQQFIASVNEELKTPEQVQQYGIEDNLELRMQIIAGKLASFDVRRSIEQQKRDNDDEKDKHAMKERAAKAGSERTWLELKKMLGR